MDHENVEGAVAPEFTEQPSIEAALDAVPEAVVSGDVLDAEIVEPAEEAAVEEVAPEAEAEAEAPAETPEVIEPVTFDAADPELLTQTSAVFDQYELPPDALAAIDALKARAESSTTQFADYGSPDDVKALLDREAYLTGVEVVDGTLRPTTNKFTETLPKETAAWLFHDLGSRASSEYDGLSQFEEVVAKAFAKEGESAPQVVERYHEFVNAMRNGAIGSDVPAWVAPNLREAWFELPKEERDGLSLLDPEWVNEDNQKSDVPAIEAKVQMLARIQKGIDADKRDVQREADTRATAERQFQESVLTKQTTFFDTARTQFAKDLNQRVVFSSDPKMQTLLAHQSVTLLAQAFEDGSAGDFARNALNEAGIAFDANKAKGLVEDITQASIELAAAERLATDNLGKIAVNKAQSKFRETGLKWQKFAEETLTQVAQAASTGKKEEVQKEVAKQKIALKARPATSAQPAPPQKRTAQLGPVGSQARYDALAEAMQKSEAYRQ